MDAATFLLCYDISCNRERARVERLAEGFGMRLQKSVFLCPLDTVALRALRQKIHHLDVRSGSVVLVKTAAPVRMEYFGQETGLPVVSDFAFGAL